jgi:hypothetical protein
VLTGSLYCGTVEGDASQINRVLPEPLVPAL